MAAKPAIPKANSTPAVSPITKPCPITPLDNPIANVYKHLHALLVAGTYFLNFRAIVADPVPALLVGSFPVAALQLIYCATCLPPAGTTSVPNNAASKPGTRKKGHGKQDAGISSRIVPALLSLLLTLIIGPVLLTFLLILFGAPFTTHLAHTSLTAVHISLLAGLPLVFVHGVDARSWRHVAAMMMPLDEVFGAAIGCGVGAWLGAIPIPLDWDREWQKWPVTVITGAYLGWTVGKLCGGSLLRGKMIDLDA